MNHYLHLKRWVRLRSHEGLAGLGLMGLALLSWLAVVHPAAEQLARLQEAERLSAARPAQPHPRQLSAADQLAAFYRSFPAEAATPDALAKIYQAANEQNLQLAEGHYHAHATAGGLVEYEVVVPVKGGYPQIRRFLAAVLANLPNASLDHVAFAREKVGDELIQARITFTLYLSRAS